MTWAEFKAGAPELAAMCEEKFEETGLVLVGTLRKNGWPRISPVEPLIVEGHLYLGMMWRSRKAIDLLRDPRCTINSVVSNRDGTEGEFKVYGMAVDVRDPEERHRYVEAMAPKIGVSLEVFAEEYHLFSIEVQSASYAVIESGKWVRKIWSGHCQ
jgi:hypothetical protein